MKDYEQIAKCMERMERRLEEIDGKLDALTATRHKSMQWIAKMSEHVESLDAFREEVRATFEPLFDKLQGLDEVLRIMRHATSDVARRVEAIESRRLAS